MSVPVRWLLRGTPKSASSRLHGYLIHDCLRRHCRRQIDSEIILRPPVWLSGCPWPASLVHEFAAASAGSVVVMQKLVGLEFASLPGLVRGSGGATLYVHCDLDPENPLPFLCDSIVVPSTALTDWYRDRGAANVRIIPDPSEFAWPRLPAREPRWSGLTIGWVGHRKNWDSLLELRSMLAEDEFRDFCLITISNHPDADLAWSIPRVREQLPRYDLAVLPDADRADAAYKSANRLVMMMAAGVPVIAARLEAYEEVLGRYPCGFLYNSSEELRCCLRRLRDPCLRAAFAISGHEAANTQYSLAAAVRQWVELFQALPLAALPSGFGQRRRLNRAVLGSELQMMRLATFCG